jgi:uncharacterized protein involved in type VI secretion and phage assembly
MTEANDHDAEDRDAQDRERGDQRFFGVHVGVVLDNQDPSQLGRILVRVPALGGAKGRSGQWARVAVPRAGRQRGTWLLPDIDDEVLVAFEAGEAARPYVVGSLWGSGHPPPEQMEPGNPLTSIVSAAGSRITIDDRADHLGLRLATPSGRSVTLDDADGTITIDGGSGATIVITPLSIEITCPGTVKLMTSMAELTASSLQLNCAMTRASGVVQCQTLIADSVVAASYTPGAGNVM